MQDSILWKTHPHNYCVCSRHYGKTVHITIQRRSRNGNKQINELQSLRCAGCENRKTCPHCGAKVKKGHPVLIGVLVVIILFAVIGAVGSSNEPKKVETPTQSQNSNIISTKAPEQPTAKVPEQTTAPKKIEKTAFLVGETAELKNVQVTLKSVTESTGSAYNKPADGNVFVLCEFDIANNSDSEITVSSLMSFDAYCDDYACTFSLSALMEKGSKNQLDGTVAAGKKFSGVVGYEVPTDWQELEINFTPDVWSGKDITFIATNG